MRKLTLLVTAFALVAGFVFMPMPRAQAARSVWAEGQVTAIGQTEGPTRCALVTDQPYCWGSNGNGSVGDGTTKSTSYPTGVDTSGVLSGRAVTEVSSGLSHTCAVADGQAFCWGSNLGGLLGNNSTTNSPVPVAVDTSGVLNGKTVTSISAGETHTCVLAEGEVFCWGENGSGQLGDNSTTDSQVPVAVDTSGVLSGRTITSIAAGGERTCAIADGQAFCWGSNYRGGLGNNSTTDSQVPVAVDTSGVLSGKTVDKLSADISHVCALTDGALYCWGDNTNGRLGNNSTTESHVPVAVDTSGVLSGKTVTDFSVGSNMTCAVADGQAFCWGSNLHGRLGNSSTTDSHVPVAVDTSGVLSGKTVNQVEAGGGGGCALAGGSVYCWGYNAAGQVGDGTLDTRNAPVATLSMTPEITDISFSDDGPNRVLTVNGDWTFSNVTEGLYEPSAPLIEMNGSTVPFCTNSTYSSDILSQIGIDPSFYSDEPLCFLLLDESAAPLMSGTQVQILLPEGFNEAAPVTIRVSDAGPTTLGAGGEQEEVESSVTVDGKSLSGTPEISKRPTFSGKTEPFSEVVVTVNSDPVICTTTADANGDWSCTLPSDLEPGLHHVTVQVTTPDSQVLTLGPYAVQVLGASTSIGGNLADTGFALLVPVVAAMLISVIALGSKRQSAA